MQEENLSNLSRLGEESLATTINKRVKEMEKHLSAFRERAKEDYGFVAGSGQWSAEDLAHMRENQRVPSVYNRIDPVIDAVCGLEVNNRQEIRFFPREMGDVQANEIYSQAADWVRDSCDAEDEESQAFRDTLVCGLGWMEIRLDFDNDPDGMPVLNRVSPFEVYYDPRAKRKNLSDARDIARQKMTPIESVCEAWPEKKDEIYTAFGEDGDMPASSSNSNADSPDEYADSESTPSPIAGQKVVTEYQWWERGTFYNVIDPTTGNIVELSRSKAQKLREVFQRNGVPFKASKITRRKFYRAFLIGNILLEKKDSPAKDDFTYFAITGKFDEVQKVFYGIVAPMKDPQRWSNKLFSTIMQILSTNATGGLMAERGAIINQRDLERNWAKPNSINIFESGALSGNKVREKGMSAFPAGLDRMMQFSIQSIPDVSGINVEMMGLADRQQPGILEQQRKQAGMTILAGYFDALRRYRKAMGRVLLQYIQDYISDGRLIRVVGKDGLDQYLPLIRQNDAKYDTIVDESPTSPHQKEKVFAVLQQMLPQLQAAGVPLPPDLLDYTPLPSSLIQKWKEFMQKPNPEAEEQKALATQKAVGEIEKDKASAAYDMAKVESEKLNNMQSVGMAPKFYQ